MSLAVHLSLGVFISVLLVAVVSTGTASATQIHDDIGISLGNTCLAMIRNNVTTDCPTYDALMAIYPDTSDQKWSGGFAVIDGIYQREYPRTDHYNIYQYEPQKKRIWIDPPGDTINRLNMIRIEPSIPIYKLAGQQTISFNSTGAELTSAHSRYITPNCSESVISAKAWLLLLGDTMNILLNSCDKSVSQFDEKKTTSFNSTQFDITTSYKYKLDKWYEYAKEISKSTFLIPK